MSREKAARSSFYNVLVNTLLVPGGSGDKVPISDGKAETKAKLYVLIEGQTARGDSDFHRRRWNAGLSISIMHKQAASYTRDIVDDVCQQIEDIVTPGIAANNGLPAPSGWQITNVRLDDVSYADFQISDTETICVKFLTFNFIITKI
jgi:hypothetical protein